MQAPARFQAALFALFVAFFIYWLSDSPYELHVVIHIVPTCLAVVLLAISITQFPLSSARFCGIICFLALHVLGTRYIYTFVPYPRWADTLLGANVRETLSGRNHYDRFVHVSYGLLIVPFAREAYQRLARVSFSWNCFFAVEFILASSLLFEIAEWLGAVNLAPEFADSYLGQQGDLWDAHKDMGLAFIGAVMSVAVLILVKSVGGDQRKPAADAEAKHPTNATTVVSNLSLQTRLPPSLSYTAPLP